MAFVKFTGWYVGCHPQTHEVYADETHGPGAWETVTIVPYKQGVAISFNDDTGQLAVNEHSRKLERRPKGDLGGWGGWWRISEDGKVAAISDELATVRLDVEGYTPPPAVKPLHLEQRGNEFVDASGNRIVLAGVDMFPALRFFKDGGPEALKPFFAESARLGFQVWRVWSQGSKRQNNFLDLSPKEAGYYDAIRPFADLCNANGIAPLLTGYVDNQDVQSPLGHWSELGKRLVGSKTLLSGFNQWTKNQQKDSSGNYVFKPQDLPSPGAGLIWSRGSDVDDVMTHPKGAPAGELHATRQSFDRALMDATASPPTMRKPENGYGMCWMTEGNPFGDSNGYSEQQAWCLGRGYSILWALAVFHNRQSQFGQLMTEPTAKCAAAWVKGMQL